ncbi:MAG: 30S ribosomal protein S12 methylthiotransferase RimO [Lachnospiraceae bacterium]|nr:30S ribosomal protein S12 methylthiotransferase RimO [Lachnospiraceae bacterium]
MTNNGRIKWTGKAPSIMLISLGCDKNLVDSEQMLSMLDEAGCTFTDEADKADVIIINSCCFIGDAKEESINTIIQAGKLKNEKLKGLIVTGCLAQRYADEIKKELPEVDAILGTTCFTDIVESVQQVLCGSFVQRTGDIDKYAYAKGHRLLTGGGYYAYLKIAEGCNKNCSYCVIPKVRGHYRSVPEEDLISDAKMLASSGVKELILIAQETTVYGTDLYKKKALPGLLRKLCAIDGIEWIRLMYCYPEEITDELIDVIASEEKICHYLDLPIQHINDDILKAMGRKTDKASLLDTIGRIKSRIPDIALRTTLISGFPGESDIQHEELKAFIKEIRFDRLGCFTYSKEEGTAAALMKGQNKETVKKKRRGELMELQQEIAFEKESLMCGRKLKVLIEGKLPDDDVYVGRTYRDAPDVDGLIFINNAQSEYMSGDFVNVKVTGSHGYDLTGDVI